MKMEMLFSGIGGQGVMALGESICAAAIKAGYEVTFVPFYGSEKRGGRTMCNIVIADQMESPIVAKPSIMLIMDERSLEDYQDTIAKDGTLIINTNLVGIEPSCECAKIVKLPFYDMAEQVGTVKSANMVAMGAVAQLLPMIKYEDLAGEVEAYFSKKPKLIPANLEALRIGYETEF